MVAIDSLIPLVAIEAPLCPEPVVRHALRLASQEFFQQTELWRVECDPVTTVDSATVDLDLPANTFLVAPYQVYANGKLVTQSRPELVATTASSWMSQEGKDIAAYWVDGPATLRVWPINTDAAQVTAYVAVAPTLDLDQLPDVVDAHRQTLIAGALWKLQAMVGKAWSNDLAAATNGALFNAGTVRAKIFATRQGMGQMRIMMRRV